MKCGRSLKKKKNRKRSHLSEETKELIQRRKNLKVMDLVLSQNQAEYTRLNNLVKKQTIADDIKWADEIAKDLENSAEWGNQRQVWQNITIVANRKTKKTPTVRDESGKPIVDPKAQCKRWRGYFNNLLNPTNINMDIEELAGHERMESFIDLDDEDCLLQL